jgi:DNA-binding FadR family transcriptional regulator
MAHSTRRSRPSVPSPPFDGVHQAEPSRLYQKIARILIHELSTGKYQVGDRMPAERDLAKRYGISRPVVREAMLTLEVLGLIEVRVGSGAYVVRLPGEDDRPGFNVTPFELMEARVLFEGEAAALAASHITDEEVAELETLVEAIRNENSRPGGKEEADHAFHMTIANATRNAAIKNVVEELWRLRSASPDCALLLEKARNANVRPVVEEHTCIVQALKKRDSGAARSAMRSHLGAVIEHLLFAVEERAIEEAKNSVALTRRRYISTTGI